MGCEGKNYQTLRGREFYENGFKISITIATCFLPIWAS